MTDISLFQKITCREITMIELFYNSEMKEADRLAMKNGISGLFLMEQAGLQLATEVEAICGGPAKVCVLAGPGNNGGDAFADARLLYERGYKIGIFKTCLNNMQNEAAETDAIHMEKKWIQVGGDIKDLNDSPSFISELDEADLIIDGIFGAGLNRPIDHPLNQIIDCVNQTKTPVLSIDIPSGLNGDTGQIMGCAIKAKYTCSFHRPKPGHFLNPGKSLCGDLKIKSIGMPERITDQINSRVSINTPEIWNKYLTHRAEYSHKYHHGAVCVVSGDSSMRGATVLASNAAIKMGAGLVTLSVDEDNLTSHPKSYAAIMLSKNPTNEHNDDWSQFLSNKKINTTLIGPGSAPSNQTKGRVLSILASNSNVVLDAGAITAFASSQSLLFSAIRNKLISNKFSSVILTPHEGEFKKLFGEYEAAGKLKAAIEAAKLSGAVIVLKGADTIIASPDGRAILNGNAPATLSTAGTGDVLAGIISALQAKKTFPAFEGAAAAVYIHAECAKSLNRELIANDLVGQIQTIKNKYMMEEDKAN